MFLKVNGKSQEKKPLDSREYLKSTSEDIIPEGSELYKGIRKKYKTKPVFRLVGRKGNNSEGDGMDMIQEMAKMNKAEIALFAMIELNLDWETNIGIVRNPKDNKSLTNKIYAGYKLLRAKDLVRRVQREMYMINPKLIIPGDNYIKCKHTYDNLL